MTNGKSDDTPPEGIQQPDQQEGAQLNVLAQYIKDLSFESPNTPASLKGPGENPNLKVNVNVNASKKEDDIYEAAISFSAEATNDTGSIYVMEAVYAGLFRLKGIPEQALHPVLFINCPNLLFPYLRRLVSDLTREGGFPPLALDPIDFATLYKQKLEQMKAEKENGAPAPAGTA